MDYFHNEHLWVAPIVADFEVYLQVDSIEVGPEVRLPRYSTAGCPEVCLREYSTGHCAEEYCCEWRLWALHWAVRHLVAARWDSVGFVARLLQPVKAALMGKDFLLQEHRNIGELPPV
jgi:hypothetical protein